AVARLRCGDPAGATALAERALTAAGSAADRRGEGRALDLLGSIDQQQGRSDLSRAYFERALAVHRAAGDRAGEGDALSNLGAWFAEQGRLDEARDRFVEALAVGDRQTEAFTLGRLANVLSVRDPTAARGYYDRSLALHREAGDRRLEGGVLGALGTLHRDAGRVDEARACYELGLRIQATLGLPQDPQILCGLGNLDLNQGRLDDAHDRFTRAVASAIALGRTAFEAVARINLGMALNELGRRDEAIAQYERALALHRARGDRRNEATTQMNLGIVLLDRTRMEEALALYRALGDPKFEALALCNLGELHLLQGRLGEAREVLVDANALARAHASKRFDALSSGLLGGLCAAEHRYDEARDWFDRAAQALRELGNPVELGRVLIRAASAAVSAGDLRTAEAALREAASLGDRVAGPGSEVGQGIAEVRSRIVPSRP
ncbi:MAG: tetratricopeptide repeat protein, partial [Myxococcota bacterium]